MKRLLLQIWSFLPKRLQNLASLILRPRYQVSTGAIIFNDRGQLLLCEHTYRRLRPWGLPGGDLKVGEDPMDGVKREVFEETGLSVQNARLFLAESSGEVQRVLLTYHCTGIRGSFVENEEVRRIKYFDITELPEFCPQEHTTIQKALALLKAEQVI